MANKPAKGRSKKAAEAKPRTSTATPPHQRSSKPHDAPIEVAKPQAQPAIVEVPSPPPAPLAPAPRATEVRPMGFAAPVTVTLSSVGVSRAINLDWQNGAPVAVLVLGASANTTATIQMTLDDIMMTPAANVVWINDPNFTVATSNTSVAFTYTQPLAAIRLNSSAASGLSPLTMKVTQGSWL
jgi:hypothetical protein